MKKLESFSNILQFHVCCHLDMPAVSLAFSSSRHALCYGLVAFLDFFMFLLRSYAYYIIISILSSHHSSFNMLLAIQDELYTLI